MIAKKYLEKAYTLEQDINIKLEQIMQLRTLAEKVTVSYGTESVKHTRNVHATEDVMAKLIDMENALNREIDELIDTKMRITEMIGGVQDETCRLILQMRYLCYQDWNHIAEELNLSRRWTLTEHERARDALSELLKRKGEQK